MIIMSWFRRYCLTIVNGTIRFKVFLLVILSMLLLVNLRRIPTASLQNSNNNPTPLHQQPTSPPRICLGREKYKEWISALFELAPAAPNCSDVETFISNYKETSPQWVYGTIVLQRNQNYNSTNTNTKTRPYHDAYEIMDFETKRRASGGRKGFFAQIWQDANEHRMLPPNLEMILYINDKPRVNPAVNRLPVFVIAGLFPAGSSLPIQWHGYVPFPSHFFGMVPDDTPPNRTEFFQKRPVVYFRGQFSEMGWSRYNTSQEYLSTPRFKLANATKFAADLDVLDIAITGFGAVPSPDQQKYICQDLLDKYNITMGQWIQTDSTNGNAMMSLSVPGNGWPGATTMRGLISNTAMLKVFDDGIDNEGYNRNTGEIYFPMLTPGVEYVSVEYDTIASTAREIRNDTEKLFQLNYAAYLFAQSYLGYECALDIVELLAWRYYEYVLSGCATAFSHVQM
jgi:hypothetical protein